MADDGTFKRRALRRLVLEAILVAGVLTGAAIGVYLATRPPAIHNERAVGGRNVDVSRADRAQYEVRVAVDPSNPRSLLGGAEDQADDALVYSSLDGGATWNSGPAPPLLRGSCGLSHPAVAIGRNHLQVYASLASESCQPPDPHLYVGVRRGPAGRWSVRQVAPPHSYAFDRRPAVAVDSRGRIYVAWPRIFGEFTSRQGLLVSRSDDGGRSWTAPARVAGYGGLYSVDLAAGAAGDVYLAVADGSGRKIDLLRSTDGARTWARRLRVAGLAEPYVVGCGAGGIFLPAQPQRCVGPTPSIAIGPSGEVSVVYSEPEANGTQAVYVAATNRTLRRLPRQRRVGPPDRRPSDQFLPVAASDRSTGDLWACYYDTFGDPQRKRAWFTCTFSADGGRRWAPPVHAASARSDETQPPDEPNGYGETEGLAASSGVAHPMWTDARDLIGADEEIYTAAIPARPGR